ncbi:MAG: hypothetical protein Q9183_005219 [Haloplaca sp. 2 TL-2023]
MTLERRLGQEQADHRKAKDTAAIELARIRNINDALQRNHEDDLRGLRKESESLQQDLRRQHEAEVRRLDGEMQRLKASNETALDRMRERDNAEMEDLRTTISRLRTELEKSSKEHVQDLQTAHEDYSTKLSNLESRTQRAEDRCADADSRASRFKEEAESKEAARNTTQTELDDLLMVLGDLEEKRSRDRERLKALGESLSDGEDDEDGDEVEDGDGEDGEDGEGQEDGVIANEKGATDAVKAGA